MKFKNGDTGFWLFASKPSKVMECSVDGHKYKGLFKGRLFYCRHCKKFETSASKAYVEVGKRIKAAFYRGLNDPDIKPIDFNNL